MLDDLVEDQRRLQPGREGVELGDRAREGAGRAAELAVREIGPRGIAEAAVGESELAGQRGRIVEEGARGRDIGAHVGAAERRGVAGELGGGVGGREEGRGPRLLQRHVGAEDRRVGRAHDAEHPAVQVDHRDGDLGAAVERPADLGAGGGHHLERFFEDGADLGGGERLAGGVGAGDDRDSGSRRRRW